MPFFVREAPNTLNFFKFERRDFMRTHNIKFSLWLNEKEYIKLEKLAKTTGFKKAPLIRNLIMGCEVKPHPPEQLPKLLRELSAIGNNINQIARVANSTGEINYQGLNEIQTLLRNIWRNLKGW